MKKNKIGIIIDGASSMPFSDYKKYDVKRVYLRIIDLKKNIEYKDDENLKDEFIYESLKNGTSFKTSCTPIGELYDAVEELLKKNDEVIIFTIHKYISSQYDNCKMVASEYPNKVFVVNGNNMDRDYEYFVQKARELANQGMDAKSIVEQIDNESKYFATLFTCETLKGLESSGRFGRLMGKILDKLKMHPVINLQNDKPSFYGFTRDYYKAIEKMVNGFIKENKLNGIQDIEEVTLYSTLLDKDKEDYFVQWLSNKFNLPKEQIRISSNPLVVCVYTGINAYGIALKIKR